MSQEIHVIHTDQLDINNDEIVLYYDVQTRILTDDGYGAFEFQTHGIEFNIEAPGLSKILKRHGCKVTPDGDFVKVLAKDQVHYTHNDVTALTTCYQQIQTHYLGGI